MEKTLFGSNRIYDSNKELITSEAPTRLLPTTAAAVQIFLPPAATPHPREGNKDGESRRAGHSRLGKDYRRILSTVVLVNEI